MISDKDQTSFLDFVRPPVGTKLGICIGTTYNLDFPALVQVALSTQRESRSFSPQNDSNSEQIKNFTGNPLSLSEAFCYLTEFESRSIVFCQSCRISKVPKELFEAKKNARQKLLSLLDSTIVALPSPSSNSCFHPKLWLLRFDGIANPKESQWRVMITSRNLSEGKQWEIACQLEGQTTSRIQKKNTVLKGFLEHLLKTKSLSSKSRDLLNKAIKQVPFVEFESPDGFFGFEFHLKTKEQETLPVLDCKVYSEIIAVSPFLSNEALNQYKTFAKKTLITSSKDLVKLEKAEDLLNTTFLFNLDGINLHAKLYLCSLKNGVGAHAYIGSANLTRAAMLRGGENTEALVCLHSKRDLVAEFKHSFIYEKSGKNHILHRWLTKISKDDLERSEQEHIEEEKLKELEAIRKSISCGSFVLRSKGKLRWNLKWHGKRFVIPKDLNTELTFSEGGKKISLAHFLNQKDGVTVVAKHPSGFLRVTIQKPGVGKIEFDTVAEILSDRSGRNLDIQKSVMEDSDAAEMLKALLPEAQISQQSIEFSNLHSQVKSQSSSKGIRYKISNFIEVILLADTSDILKSEQIDVAIMHLEKDKQYDATLLKKFWQNYKSAKKRIDRDAA